MAEKYCGAAILPQLRGKLTSRCSRSHKLGGAAPRLPTDRRTKAGPGGVDHQSDNTLRPASVIRSHVTTIALSPAAYVPVSRYYLEASGQQSVNG
jgi:hypothetical protein